MFNAISKVEFEGYMNTLNNWKQHWPHSNACSARLRYICSMFTLNLTCKQIRRLLTQPNLGNLQFVQTAKWSANVREEVKRHRPDLFAQWYYPTDRKIEAEDVDWTKNWAKSLHIKKLWLHSRLFRGNEEVRNIVLYRAICYKNEGPVRRRWTSDAVLAIHMIEKRSYA